MGSSPVAVTCTSDIAPVSSKKFFDIQATIECGFPLKRVRDMTRTYSQINTNVVKLGICLVNGKELQLEYHKGVSLEPYFLTPS